MRDETREQFRARLIAFEKLLEGRLAEFRCPVHLCLGQEEVPVVLHEHLRPTDWLFSSHRSHGHYLAKGGDERALLDEIEGKPSGVNGGYSGSQSFCDPAMQFHSTAIIGGLVGVAAGTALSVKLRGGSEFVVCCIGDSATEQGIFWESLNFASLHRLPLLYVVENNGLSVHAPIHLRQATRLEPRVRAFGATHMVGVHGLVWMLGSRDGVSLLPAVVEVACVRACAHVSAMEDLRE